MLAIRPVTYEVETSLSPTTVTIPFSMATAQTPKAFRYSTTPPKSVTEAQQAFMER